MAERDRDATTDERRAVVLPGVVLGLGLGGFVDGIVFHQLLQWHHLISSTEKGTTDTVAGLEANTLADGVFHAAMWGLTALGVWLLWRAVSRLRIALGRRLAGWLLVGWGLFNLADEVVMHALLDPHHIREGANELVYDLAYLAVALVLLVAGLLLGRSPGRPTGVTSGA